MSTEDTSQMNEGMEASSETANDLFKRSFDSWFWGSMIVATFVHAALFQFWPTLTAEDVSFTAEELEAIELPPEIEIPPPPEAISRPATPVIATATVDEDITIAPTTFEDNPVEDLPPPPTETTVDIAAAPTFTNDGPARNKEQICCHPGDGERLSSYSSGCRYWRSGSGLVLH